MSFFRRISRWFTTSDEPKKIPNTVLLQELINKARRAQYAEEYDDALDLLAQAMEIATKEHNTRAQVDITLSRADILIAKQDYDTAEFVLKELIEDSRARQLNAPLAYALCSLGVMEQRKGNLSSAQNFYEDARETAEKIDTDGASGRANAHLGDIYLLQGNASYAVYLLEEAVTRLDRSGDRELLGYFFSKLALAQFEIGQTDQGEVRLQRGLDLAITIQHHSQMRYLNTLLGNYSLTQNSFRRALSYYLDALRLYPEPPPQTTEYAELLCQISKVSVRLGEAHNARKYAEQALPIAEAISEQSLIAMAKAAIGLSMQAEDDDNAGSYLQAAVEAYDSVEADTFYINILRSLAKSQIKLGDAAQGITTYEKAIKEARDLPYEIAKTQSELAQLYADKRELRRAVELWQDAIKHFQEANASGDIARAHCDIASMYDQLGDGRFAQREYGTALEMLSRIDDATTRGVILANVAAAYSEYGDVESAQDFFKEAIEIAQRTRNQGAEALRRGNYGRLLAVTNRPKDALTQLMQAQRKSEELDLQLQASIILGNIGLAYGMMDDISSATERYQLALMELKTLNADRWMATVHANWGDTALSVSDNKTANEQYALASTIAHDSELIDILIQSTIGQAQVAIRQDDLDTAEQHLSDIDTVAKRQNYRRLLALLHQTYSQLYAKQGDAEKAQSAWDTAKKLRDIMQMKTISADWL